jgi:DNA-binding response OmpR family regulator
MNLVRPINPCVASSEIPESIEPAASSNRILVVDDDDMIRELLAKGLRRADYWVSCANNGETGWNTFCAESFDLLITDHEMPRLTGLNLLRRIRLGPLKVPVILMSGSLPWGEDDLMGLLPPGVAMEKPFFLAEMLRNIRRLLPAGTASGAGTGNDGMAEDFYGEGTPLPG